MTNNNDTIDYDSRADICSHVDRVRGHLDIIKSLLRCEEGLDVNTVDDLFEHVFFELTAIHQIAWGNKNPHALLASPFAAFEIYKKISEHTLGQERDKYYKGQEDGQ